MTLFSSRMWFWLLRRTYPWTALAILAWRMLWLCDRSLIELQVRWLVTLAKLDWASLIAMAMEWLVPEAWI